MNDEEVRGKVEQLFKESFQEVEALDFNKTQDQYESWDSFAHMELVAKIEKAFSITLETEEVVELDTAEKVVEVVMKKRDA